MARSGAVPDSCASQSSTRGAREFGNEAKAHRAVLWCQAEPKRNEDTLVAAVWRAQAARAWTRRALSAFGFGADFRGVALSVPSQITCPKERRHR